MAVSADLGRALLASLDDGALDELATRLAPMLAGKLPTAERVVADKWLTAREAAAYLGLTLDALHKRTRRRSIPAVQESAGGKLYFLRSELDRWRLEHSNGA
jgi:excisionase family DNA binding protein